MAASAVLNHISRVQLMTLQQQFMLLLDKAMQVYSVPSMCGEEQPQYLMTAHLHCTSHSMSCNDISFHKCQLLEETLPRSVLYLMTVPTNHTCNCTYLHRNKAWKLIGCMCVFLVLCTSLFIIGHTYTYASGDMHG